MGLVALVLVSTSYETEIILLVLREDYVDPNCFF